MARVMPEGTLIIKKKTNKPVSEIFSVLQTPLTWEQQVNISELTYLEEEWRSKGIPRTLRNAHTFLHPFFCCFFYLVSEEKKKMRRY